MTRSLDFDQGAGGSNKEQKAGGSDVTESVMKIPQLLCGSWSVGCSVGQKPHRNLQKSTMESRGKSQTGMLG